MTDCDPHSRTRVLLGDEAITTLRSSSVAVFGLGGVGSYVAETLCRSGVGSLTLVDADVVSVSNLNRQLCALHSTIGLHKTDAMAARLRDINPSCLLELRNTFYAEAVSEEMPLDGFDYVVDAIDTVSSKVLLIRMAHESNIPIISCMGTGNRVDPMGFTVSDLSQTTGCPLARAVRRALRTVNIEHVKVVWSKELPMKRGTNGKQVLGSLPFVPPAAGLLIASEVVRDLTTGRTP